jgi:hypothetical protein
MFCLILAINSLFIFFHFQKPWGEIPCSFVQEFDNELGEDWTLVNNNNIRTTIKFNQHPHHPLGEDLFQIEGNRMILFSYLGNNLFHINIYHGQPVDLSRLPPQHTYRLSNRHYDIFDVPLTHNMATGSQLVHNNYINSVFFNNLVIITNIASLYFI